MHPWERNESDRSAAGIVVRECGVYCSASVKVWQRMWWRKCSLEKNGGRRVLCECGRRMSAKAVVRRMERRDGKSNANTRDESVIQSVTPVQQEAPRACSYQDISSSRPPPPATSRPAEEDGAVNPAEVILRRRRPRLLKPLWRHK